MIRINLLGVPKARRGGKRPAVTVSSGEGPSTPMIALIFLVILGAAMWFGYTTVTRQHASLEKDYQAATKENVRLAEVKRKYEETRQQCSAAITDADNAYAAVRLLIPSVADQARRYLDLISKQWDDALGRLRAFVEE